MAAAAATSAPGSAGTTETLTDAQKAQVKAILSKYDANTLTADTGESHP